MQILPRRLRRNYSPKSEFCKKWQKILTNSLKYDIILVQSFKEKKLMKKGAKLAARLLGAFISVVTIAGVGIACNKRYYTAFYKF